MNKTLLVVAALLLAACNSGSPDVLPPLTDVTASSQCPNGGVQISVGTDTNGNGTLDADEVKQTNHICNGGKGVAGANGDAGANGANGTNGSNGSNGTDGTNGSDGMSGPNGPMGAPGANGALALVRTTLLGPSDAQCPQGGAKIEYGLDDGAGGGTAGNGVLEVSEVLHTEKICNGATKYYPATVDVPGGPDGTSVIEAKGGYGDLLAGGAGGQIQIQLRHGSLGGAVKTFKTGSVDAGFSVPTLGFTAGNNPMIVTGAYTLRTYATKDDGISGGDEFFKVADDSTVYSHDAGTVTSLTITDAGTLTFGEDDSSNYYSYSSFSGSIRNDGIVRASISDGQVRAIELYADDTLVASQGSVFDVSARGPDASGEGLYLGAGRTMALAGSITTKGNDSGSAGTVQIYGNDIYVTGDIEATGGSNVEGQGGAGNHVTIGGKAVYLGGPIRTSGGSGFSGGGPAGLIDLSSWFGPLVFHGSIDARGGDCSTSSCTAGSGNNFSASARSADLWWNGPVDVSGGGSNSISGGGGGNTALLGAGGNAGVITLQVVEYYGFVPYLTGSAHISGSLKANGGDGPRGGNANQINVLVDPEYRPHGQELELLGYASFDSSGADSNNNQGGSGGDVLVRSKSSAINVLEENTIHAPTGPVVNTVDVVSHSGSGTSAGSSGTVQITVQDEWLFKAATEKVTNFGNIDVSSGSSTGVFEAHSAGEVYLRAPGGVENHGTITGNGANGGGGSSPTGAYGGYVELVSVTGPVVNEGDIQCHGGDDPGIGLGGGYVVFEGTHVTQSADVDLAGGNGGDKGGTGGEIQMYSSGGMASTVTGNQSVAPGTGPNGDGSPGHIVIDVHPYAL